MNNSTSHKRVRNVHPFFRSSTTRIIASSDYLSIIFHFFFLGLNKSRIEEYSGPSTLLFLRHKPLAGQKEPHDKIERNEILHLRYKKKIPTTEFSVCVFYLL